MSVTKKQKVIQAIDVEAITNTDINCIGWVVLDEDGCVLKKKEWCIKVHENIEMDPACKKNFWDKNQELLKYINDNAKDEGEQIRDFVENFDLFGENNGIEEVDIENASNNPEFDWGILTRYVKKYCNREPLRYTTKGKYRSIDDVGEALYGIGISDIINEKCTELIKHDHYPSNDAEHIALMHLIGSKVLSKIKSELQDKIKAIANEESQRVLEEIKNARKRKIDSLPKDD